MINEYDKYLFDLNGYLVIEDVLSVSELATLNEIFDGQERPTESSIFAYGGGKDSGPGCLAWGQPFVDLLDHRAIMQLLRFRLGDCFRLDRLYTMAMSAGMPMGKMHSDYGASSPISRAVPGEYYPFPVNEIHSGFTVVSWNLTDAGPGIGGFCCIPGSHKSNFKLPQQIAESSGTSESAELFPHTIIPRAPAGSVTFFTEALTHGTAAWKADHERRTLLYKYCVSQLAWGTGCVRPPADCELTARQQLLLAEPAEPYRFFPSLFELEEDTSE